MKNKIIIILFIFLILFILIYTYLNFNKKKNIEKNLSDQKIEEETSYNSNIILDVYYSSTDMKGNEYIIYAQKGEIGGPVRIAELSGQALVSGFIPLIFFGALISLNLALVNLLPIPALDGGHIVLYIIEIILGKPLPIHVQNILMRGGVSILLALMILITIYDVARFF